MNPSPNDAFLKTSPPNPAPVIPLPGLQRSMTARHLVMIALGGVIGSGLFLSSGYTIYQAGPLGAVIAYLIGAVVVYLVLAWASSHLHTRFRVPFTFTLRARLTRPPDSLRPGSTGLTGL
jgi:cytosine/uracil/thiamine/allantoin permease